MEDAWKVRHERVTPSLLGSNECGHLIITLQNSYSPVFTAADTLYHFLVRVDTEAKFLKHLDRRLGVGISGLRAAKARGGFGGDENWVITDDVEASCDFTITTLRFMQLLCEGHNIKVIFFTLFSCI